MVALSMAGVGCAGEEGVLYPELLPPAEVTAVPGDAQVWVRWTESPSGEVRDDFGVVPGGVAQGGYVLLRNLGGTVDSIDIAALADDSDLHAFVRQDSVDEALFERARGEVEAHLLPAATLEWGPDVVANGSLLRYALLSWSESGSVSRSSEVVEAVARRRWPAAEYAVASADSTLRVFPDWEPFLLDPRVEPARQAMGDPLVALRAAARFDSVAQVWDLAFSIAPVDSTSAVRLRVESCGLPDCDSPNARRSTSPSGWESAFHSVPIGTGEAAFVRFPGQDSTVVHYARIHFALPDSGETWIGNAGPAYTRDPGDLVYVRLAWDYMPRPEWPRF